MLGAEGAGTVGHMFISGAETFGNASTNILANDETPQAKLVILTLTVDDGRDREVSS